MTFCITPVELVTELGCEIEITGEYRSFSLSRRMIFFFFLRRMILKDNNQTVEREVL